MFFVLLYRCRLSCGTTLVFACPEALSNTTTPPPPCVIPVYHMGRRRFRTPSGTRQDRETLTHENQGHSHMLRRSARVCVGVHVFTKLHITAQSGSVIALILPRGINDIYYENLGSSATMRTHSLYLYSSLILKPGYLVLPSLLPCYSIL